MPPHRRCVWQVRVEGRGLVMKSQSAGHEHTRHVWMQGGMAVTRSRGGHDKTGVKVGDGARIRINIRIATQAHAAWQRGKKPASRLLQFLIDLRQPGDPAKPKQTCTCAGPTTLPILLSPNDLLSLQRRVQGELTDCRHLRNNGGGLLGSGRCSNDALRPCSPSRRARGGILLS